MIDYRLMTIDDYDVAYDLWVKCGNGLNDKDDSREGIEKYLNRNPNTSFVAVKDKRIVGESQGFALREDLNYRNRALVDLIRIDPEYVK